VSKFVNVIAQMSQPYPTNIFLFIQWLICRIVVLVRSPACYGEQFCEVAWSIVRFSPQ
jgi:hypothetical protein